MNIEDAAYHTAHDYPGGVPALAARLGVSSNVLNHKVNPNQVFHKLTLSEAEKLVGLTQDRRIPEVFASIVGCVMVCAGSYEGMSDIALLDAYANMMSDLGDFSREFNLALQDGRITQDEIDAMEKKLYHFQSAGAELLNRVRQMVEPEQTKAAL